MTDESHDDGRRAAMAAWITGRVAVYLERRPEDIDPEVTFSVYGLQSVYALALCGDVEDTYGIAVEPSLAWDHPTVNALAAHLVEATAESRS